MRKHYAGAINRRGEVSSGRVSFAAGALLAVFVGLLGFGIYLIESNGDLGSVLDHSFSTRARAMALGPVSSALPSHLG